MWWWNEGWYGWWPAAPLMMIGCMALMGLMMFVMFGHGHRRWTTERDVLDRRLERGEINEGEYHEGRRILGL
jgi:uncharacterized membrane protein